MGILAIKNPKNQTEHRLSHEIHRLSARIFRGRLERRVRCTSGLKIDGFDKLGPTYVLCIDRSDAVFGCARLLPATGGTVVENVLPQLLGAKRPQTYPRVIRSSRFCADTNTANEQERTGVHSETLAIRAGSVEWSILNVYTEIVTATDIVRLERILRRAGWLNRLGASVQFDETRGVAGLLPADWRTFDRLRPGIYSSNLSFPKKEAA